MSDQDRSAWVTLEQYTEEVKENERLREQLVHAKSILIALDQVLDFAGYEDLGHTWTFDDLAQVAETFAKSHAFLTDEQS